MMTHFQLSPLNDVALLALTAKKMLIQHEVISAFVDTEVEAHCRKSFEKLLAASRRKP